MRLLRRWLPSVHPTAWRSTRSSRPVPRMTPRVVLAGSVTDLRELIQPEAGRIGTPSNVWALDRSWFVLTDWDLLAPKVSGPLELIEMIESAARLETIRWP